MAIRHLMRYIASMLNVDPTKSTLTTDAYERLRADLLASRIPPGSRIKINDMCDRLLVSLSAVREALSRLTSDGLVVAEPNRGFRAAPISAEELRDLTAVRIRIEGACLSSAITLGDVRWESNLVAAYHELSRTAEREPGDQERMSEDWSIVHAGFHTALVSACDSTWLRRLRAMLFAQSERYRRLSVPLAAISRDLNQEHRDIMEAAISRDNKRAQKLLMEHLQLTTRVLLDAEWPFAEIGPPHRKLSRARAKAEVARAMDRRQMCEGSVIGQRPGIKRRAAPVAKTP